MKKLFICLLASLCITSCTKTEYNIFSTLCGTVYDHETGKPLSTVTLVLSPGGTSKITGNDGYFEFKELTPQQYTVTAQKDGYQTNRKNVTATTGEITEINITMQQIAK